MVDLVFRKEDATKEKSIINKEEEESTCLEIKKSYASTFTKGGERKAIRYLQSKYISPYKGNEKRNLYNSSTIIDENWSRKRPSHGKDGIYI